MIYAIIDQFNSVINVIFWDGESQWIPPENCTAVHVTGESAVSIGWTYVDGEFIPPQE
jgi:hypothetical protein